MSEQAKQRLTGDIVVLFASALIIVVFVYIGAL
jgi:hypothetical protein